VRVRFEAGAARGSYGDAVEAAPSARGQASSSIGGTRPRRAGRRDRGGAVWRRRCRQAAARGWAGGDVASMAPSPTRRQNKRAASTSTGCCAPRAGRGPGRAEAVAVERWADTWRPRPHHRSAAGRRRDARRRGGAARPGQEKALAETVAASLRHLHPLRQLRVSCPDLAVVCVGGGCSAGRLLQGLRAVPRNARPAR
jgi:hypothetical protein